MLIDIHSHINSQHFGKEQADVIKRAKEAGVEKIVCVGCDRDSCLSAIELAQQFENVYAAIGLHPNYAFEFDEQFENLLKTAKFNKKIVSIGEIGLDFYNLDWQIDEITAKNQSLKPSKEEFIQKQKEVFLRQLEIANELGLPVTIHMREATNETLKIFEENKNLLANGGILHCFSGSLETVKRVFNLGLHISIGGTITFKNSRVMPEVLKQIGISKVILETDCPYLCPEPFRGQRNEPKNVLIISRKIAEIVGVSQEEVEKITTQNALRVFPRLGIDGKF